MVRGAKLNRDDLPIVEYRAPFDLYRIGYEIGKSELRTQSAPLPLPETDRRAAPRLFADWSPERWYGARAEQLLRQREHDRARLTARWATEAGLPAIGVSVEREVRANEHRRDVELEHATARAAGRIEKYAEALAALTRAAALDSSNGRTWVLMAEARRQLRDDLGTREALARALATGTPDVRAEAEVMLGVIEIARGAMREAARHFRQAQGWDPSNAQAYRFEAQALAMGGDSAGARQALVRGLGVLPQAAELLAYQRELGAKSP